MATPFTFVDRDVEIIFFEQDPVTITMTVSDETDKKLAEYAGAVKKDRSYASCKKAMEGLIGKENLAKILKRAPVEDGYALLQVERHIGETYAEAQAKNLSPAGAGREK